MSGIALPKAPRQPRLPSVGLRVAGAPLVPRSYRGTVAQRRPEDVPPPWWIHSDLEWVVYRYLTKQKHWLIYGAHTDPDAPRTPVGVDVLYQVPIPAPGYGLKNQFEGDFWILPQGRGGSPGYPYRKGIVLDPENPFTHTDTSKDHLRRRLLASGEFLLIWIDGTDLIGPAARPQEIIELALHGKDQSSIAGGAR